MGGIPPKVSGGSWRGVGRLGAGGTYAVKGVLPGHSQGAALEY